MLNPRINRLAPSRLTEFLWTGGDLPDPLDEARDTLREWQAVGISALVDTRAEWTDEDVVAMVAPEMDYLHAGVDDGGKPMPDWWFDAITHFALDRINQRQGVLVHCHMGINRGPSAAFAILLATGWTSVAALERIRTARPIAAVGYAECAVRWWHRRLGVDPVTSAEEVEQVRSWRREHPVDAPRLVREVLSVDRLGGSN